MVTVVIVEREDGPVIPTGDLEIEPFEVDDGARLADWTDLLASPLTLDMDAELEGAEAEG